MPGLPVAADEELLEPVGPGDTDPELPPPAVIAFLVEQAPCSVDMTFMFVRAVGVEPQFSAWASHMALLSKSKVAGGTKCQ